MCAAVRGSYALAYGHWLSFTELAVEHVLELFFGRIARRVALEVNLLQLRQDLVRARIRVRVGLG